MALIFVPEASADWVSTLGVIGCLALILAVLLLIPACISLCLSRKVSMKLIVISFYHVVAKKTLGLAVIPLPVRLNLSVSISCIFASWLCH